MLAVSLAAVPLTKGATFGGHIFPTHHHIGRTFATRVGNFASYFTKNHFFFFFYGNISFSYRCFSPPVFRVWKIFNTRDRVQTLRDKLNLSPLFKLDLNLITFFPSSLPSFCLRVETRSVFFFLTVISLQLDPSNVLVSA